LRVTHVPAERAGEVVDVLCDAFREYPVMRWVLGRSNPRYDEQLRTLFGFFLAARYAWNETVLAADRDGVLLGAALVSGDRDGNEPPALGRAREATWRELGEEARARYGAFGEACRVDVDGTHLHLNAIGVRHAEAGRGIGRRLLDAVHAMSESDPRSCGVTLSTESPANVPMYEHVGYRVIHHARVNHELETWAMFRPDSGRKR
jgi:GNAT superfamily N-acetyltransferase